ncbi:hypothetical protein MVEN_00104900 [Mycena venus]|uniref:F-box domain-containing protein n=1 Tax=Mycena venus TaxID=2733690 RepID=A0A8H6Z8V3_9AGAR|nr:hypothetical protein MVEN_00104900 [Mycena venus]
MEASSLAVQEIWDQVLDHLAAHSDLKSCALVCRVFVLSAQALLFHYVRTHLAGRQMSSCLNGRPFPLTMSTNRLSDFASQAPHLIDHIRELSIVECDGETLAPIVEISWSRLRAITFERALSREMGLLAADADAVVLVSALVALPTLREISFSSFYCGSELLTILAKCGAQVCSLKFDHSDISDTALTHAHAPLPSDPRYPRPRITSLGMSVAGAIPDVIHSATSPLDLSHLNHISFLIRLSTGILPLLHDSKNTVRSLEFDGKEPDIEFLDFGAFPALSHIKLWNGTEGLAKALEISTPLIHLHTISYSLSYSLLDSEMLLLRIMPLPLLDSLVSNSVSKLPALRRVVVQLVATEYNPGHEALTSAIENQVPWLVQNGLLVIEITRWERD